MSEITLATLHDKVVEQQKTISDLIDQLSSLKEVVAKGKQISTEATPKKASVPKELVTFDGKEYKWKVAAFRLPGNEDRITAEEAATDKTIIATILSIKNQQILIEQV